MRPRGMVVAPQPLAAEVGVDVLRRGGNAVDAAVTLSMVQGVIDPHMCGLGGGGVMLVYEAATDATHAVEFYPRAGSRVSPGQWEHLFIREAADRYGYVLDGWVNDAGYQSVAVPGTVAGLDLALARFGTLSWRDALAPAVAAARDGFPVTGYVYGFWTSVGSPDSVRSRERIRWTEESRRIYTKAGELYQPGEVIRCPDYARTLERLVADGARSFYDGPIADEIAADLEANGGWVTRDDLVGYDAELAAPVRGSYHGREVVTAGPPAGGLTLLQLLNYVEGYDVGASPWPSVEAARLRVDAMAWAMREREAHLADPKFAAVAIDRLSAKDYAAAARSAHDAPDTTHVCVVDETGNAVSLTHTLGDSSGVVTPGLGFTYNNYMKCFDPRPGAPNSLAPGKTRITMMTPTMLFGDDRLEVVIGAPGGTRIVTGVFQSLLNVLDHGMDPLAAVAAPRVDLQGDTVQAEHRVTRDIVEALAEDREVVRRPVGYDMYFSKVQLVTIASDGTPTGASDPRGDGGIALRA